MALLFGSQIVFATVYGNPFVTDRTPFPHWLPPPPGSPVNSVDTFLYVLVSIVQFAETILL